MLNIRVLHITTSKAQTTGLMRYKTVRVHIPAHFIKILIEINVIDQTHYLAFMTIYTARQYIVLLL